MKINLDRVRRLIPHDVPALATRLVAGDVDEDKAATILSSLGITADKNTARLCLSKLLADVLDNLQRMGAGLDEKDIRMLRQFFMGVLRWPPDVVMREATLEDLADTYEGFMLFHRLQKNPPLSAAFLQEMMNKFPDQKGDDE